MAFHWRADDALLLSGILILSHLITVVRVGPPLTKLSGSAHVTYLIDLTRYSKPVLSSHSEIDKTKVLKTNSSLMKVEVLQNAPLGAFCNTFDLH